MSFLTSIGANGSPINMKRYFRKAIPSALCSACIMACLFGCTSNENHENTYDGLEEITFASDDDIVGNREYVGDLSIVIPDGFKDPNYNSRFNRTIKVLDGVNVEEFDEFTNEQETIFLDIYALEDTEKAEVDNVIEYLRNPETLASNYDRNISRTQINGIPAIVTEITTQNEYYYREIIVIPIANNKAAYYIKLYFITPEAETDRDYCESILSTMEIGG